jgi:hypothetical protein
MKKLFFTAIALVAFSGVSMASTIDIEELKIQEEKIEVLETNCVAEKFKAYVTAKCIVGVSTEEADDFANAIFWACMIATAPR